MFLGCVFVDSVGFGGMGWCGEVYAWGTLKCIFYLFLGSFLYIRV